MTQDADLERLQKDNQRLRERLDKLLLKKPTGARAQVVTLADCVETNEGYRYGLLLQQSEERELDLLSEIGKLRRALYRACVEEDIPEGVVLHHGDGTALIDGSDA